MAYCELILVNKHAAYELECSVGVCGRSCYTVSLAGSVDLGRPLVFTVRDMLRSDMFCTKDSIEIYQSNMYIIYIICFICLYIFSQIFISHHC